MRRDEGADSWINIHKPREQVSAGRAGGRFCLFLPSSQQKSKCCYPPSTPKQLKKKKDTLKHLIDYHCYCVLFVSVGGFANLDLLNLEAQRGTAISNKIQGLCLIEF